MLNLGDGYVSSFDAISYYVEGYGTTYINMNYDRGLEFLIDAPAYSRLSYEVYPVEDYSFGVEDFDLATCPLSMQEFLVSAIVTCGEEGAGLYIMVQQDAQPIVMLADGEAIEAIPQRWQRDWVIVCYRGNYLFMKTENCKIEE